MSDSFMQSAGLPPDEVIYPQLCIHLSCVSSPDGEVRTAMTTADSLLILRDGTLCASGPLPKHSRHSRGHSHRPQVTTDAVLSTSSVCGVRCCSVAVDIRVAVLMNDGVTVVDVKDSDAPMHYHNVCLGNCVGDDATRDACSLSPGSSFIPHWLSKKSLPDRLSEEPEVVDAEFVSFSLLVILLRYEAVVVEVGGNGDVLKWRTRASYIKTAVCPMKMYLAFVRQSNVVEVFPVRPDKDPSHTTYNPLHFQRTPVKECELALPSPLGKSVADFEPGVQGGFVSRGASTRIKAGDIQLIEWYAVLDQSLLGITCRSSDSTQLSLILFTVELLPVVGQMLSKNFEACDAVGSNSNSTHDAALLLVPRGTISLSTVSPTTLSVKSVPSVWPVCASPVWNSALDFLYLEAGGTVHLVSYHCAPMWHRCPFAQAPRTVTAPGVLSPLIAKYGQITGMDTVPDVKGWDDVFGICTPRAKDTLHVQQCRMLLYFVNGMIIQVVVNFTSLSTHVEAFLTLGTDSHSPHLITCRVAPLENPLQQTLLLGITQSRVFVLKRVMRSWLRAEVTVLAVATVPHEHLHQLMHGITHAADGARAEEKERLGEEESIRKFMEAHCADKVHMLPALLRACGGDTGKLLKQLKLKYDALQSPVYATEAEDGSYPSDPVCVDEASLGTGAERGGACDIPESHEGKDDSQTSRLHLSLFNAIVEVKQVEVTVEGIYFLIQSFTSFTVRKKWWKWYIPICLLGDSDNDAEECARIPSVAPVQCMGPYVQTLTGPCVSTPDKDDYVKLEWSLDTRSFTVQSRLWMGEQTQTLCPFEDIPLSYHLVRFSSVLMSNNVTLLAILLATSAAEPQTVLKLYGLDTLRSMATQPSFEVELVIKNVAYFFTSPTGDVFVLRQCDGTVEKWTRIATEDSVQGYTWKSYRVCLGSGQCEAVSAIAPLGTWGSEDVEESGVSLPSEETVYISPDGGLINLSHNAQSKECLEGHGGHVGTCVGGSPGSLEVYHPTPLLMLLIMRQPHTTCTVFKRIRVLASASNVPADKLTTAYILAKQICHDEFEESLLKPSSTSINNEVVSSALVSSLRSTDESIQLDNVTVGLCGHIAPIGADVPKELIDEVVETLMNVRLASLSSYDQFTLLCIVEALRATRLSGVATDSAASRCYFMHRLEQLQRRRLLHTGRNTLSKDCSSMLCKPHSSYMWAALSDAQSQLLEALVPSASSTAIGRGTVSWDEVEAVGLPFWLQSLHQLRAIAERIGREQFQKARDVRDCALMYCLARKPGVVAALCKTTGNAKLEAFFSRNFDEPKNRAAAVGNAYTAVSKNLITYGAAFFILAGEVRNAAHVLLQRHSSVSLALLALRLGSDDNPSDLLWFVEQRRREEQRCGIMNPWEEMCLLWRCGMRHEALSLLTHSAPLRSFDGVDRLMFLNFVGRQMGMERGAGGCNLLFLLAHTIRLSVSAGALLPAKICCNEAETLLSGLQMEGETNKAAGAQPKIEKMETTTSGSAPRMVAHYDTGTLIFQGFDVESDRFDEVSGSTELTCSPGATGSTPTAVPVAQCQSGKCLMGTAVEAAIVRELKFTERSLAKRTLAASFGVATKRNTGNHAHTMLVRVVHVLLAISAVRQVRQFEQHLARLLEEVHCESEPHNGEHAIQSVQVDATVRLVVVALRFALTVMAAGNGDCAFLVALLKLPTVAEVLQEENAQAEKQHTIYTYVDSLIKTRRGVGIMAMDTRLKKEGKLVPPFSKLHGGDGSEEEGPQPHVRDGKDLEQEGRLRTILLSWGVAHLQLSILSDLRLEVERVVKNMDRYSSLQLWLLAYTMCRSKNLFDKAVEDVVNCANHLRGLEHLPFLHQNGLFVQERRRMRRLVNSLEQQFVTSIKLREASAVFEKELKRIFEIVQICDKEVGAIWQLPSAGSHVSMGTETLLAALCENTLTHDAARVLYGRLKNDAATTLQRLESVWIWHHHTMTTYRARLLEVCLGMGPQGVLTTDRLVLTQSDSAICAVDFNHSDYDAIVWKTTSGVMVGGSYHEILAGDGGEVIVWNKLKCHRGARIGALPIAH
ncbi:hypothetical protein TRVL_00566 [Trypanosoma vivax]|nr:hypothetical protein TRVL_00566 [Trypanosoma vivax]